MSGADLRSAAGSGSGAAARGGPRGRPRPTGLPHFEQSFDRSFPLLGVIHYLRAGSRGERARVVLDIYNEHFGLRERPFSLVPDPDFLFWSDQHRRAFSMLEYGLMTKAPITLITGEIGSGKTTLLQQLLRTIEDDVTVGLVSNAHGDRGEILRWVLLALDQIPPEGADYVDLFGRFQDYLIDEYAAGRRVVLIFDEAQNLHREGLEELRMFTNINSGKDELLQLVLVGQPELLDLVSRPDLRQFAQRVASSFHLRSLTREMVGAYITHRLEAAGASWTIFSEAACRKVYEATGGVPRLVNQLCDLALVYAFSAEQYEVDEALLEQVLGDGVFFAGANQIKAPVLRLRTEQKVE